MPEVALRPKARADLDDIWDYTVEKWGYPQAEKYLRMLNQTFETLAENPELGRIYDELYKGLRVYPSGRHLIVTPRGGLETLAFMRGRFHNPAFGLLKASPEGEGYPVASVAGAMRGTLSEIETTDVVGLLDRAVIGPGRLR